MQAKSLGSLASHNIHHIRRKIQIYCLEKNCYKMEPDSSLKIRVQYKTVKIQILIPVIVSSAEVGFIIMSLIHTQVLDQYEIHEWIPSSKLRPNIISCNNSTF